MLGQRNAGWLNQRAAALAAAGFAILALTPLSTADAAPPSPYVFAGTETQLTPGPQNGTPGVVAIGDLHSTTHVQNTVNAIHCNYGSGLPAQPGCRNDIAVIGEQGYGEVFLRDAEDSGLTGGNFDSQNFLRPNPTTAGIADFNGDGINDVAISAPTSDVVEVDYGLGHGQFGNDQQIPIAFPGMDASLNYVSALAVGNLGNGHPDIVAVVSGATLGGDLDYGEMVVLMNNGQGQFTQTDYPTGLVPVSVAIGNLGNGRPDIAVASSGLGNQATDPGVNLFMNNGHGIFTAEPLVAAAAGTFPYGVGIGDFNGDGRPDLVTANQNVDNSGSVTVLLSNGHGYTQQVIQDQEAFSGTEFDGYGGIAAGDLNGDGRSDFAIANFNANSMTVFMSTHSASGLTFTQTTLPTDGLPDQIAIGHVNSSNGAQDIVVGDQRGDADLFTNTTPQVR